MPYISNMSSSAIIRDNVLTWSKSDAVDNVYIMYLTRENEGAYDRFLLYTSPQGNVLLYVPAHVIDLIASEGYPYLELGSWLYQHVPSPRMFLVGRKGGIISEWVSGSHWYTRGASKDEALRKMARKLIRIAREYVGSDYKYLRKIEPVSPNFAYIYIIGLPTRTGSEYSPTIYACIMPCLVYEEDNASTCISSGEPPIFDLVASLQDVSPISRSDLLELLKSAVPDLIHALYHSLEL